MRPRLTFGLAALALLFFLQGLSSLFAVLFAIAYDAVFPQPNPTALLLALLPIGSLLTPALPFSLWIERPKALALGAIGAALGRIVLCYPHFMAQYLGAAITVAAGSLFLAKSVGYLDRRRVAAAIATALVLDSLLRAAGASWTVALRPAWLPVQLVLSGAALAATLIWLRDPRMEEEGSEAQSLERRVGGLRLRGAVALAVILFLEQNVLASAAVGARWTGESYALVATLLAASGATAVALLLGARGPVGRHRRAALTLVGIAAIGAALAPRNLVSPRIELAAFVAGHMAALLLLGRAVVPAGGRRRGWTLAAGLGLLFVLNLLFAFTFFYAFTVPAMRGALGPLIIGAGVLLALVLALVPRPLPSAPHLARPALALPAIAAAGALAWMVAPRPPTLRPIDRDVVVATYNVHYGFDESWRYDPEQIARTIEESGADIVALQEVPAGMLTAHGTDLALWLGQRLGMRALTSPSINGLLGDAVLTRLPVLDFESSLLPPETSDRKAIARASLAVGNDTLVVYATHFGLTSAEQAMQVNAALRRLTASGAAVFMGDLNADEISDVARALRGAGFRDAFEAGGELPAPTAPATRPSTRIDWIWVRDVAVTDAEVSSGVGSDHRLVAATIRLRTTDTEERVLSQRR